MPDPVVLTPPEVENGEFRQPGDDFNRTFHIALDRKLGEIRKRARHPLAVECRTVTRVAARLLGPNHARVRWTDVVAVNVWQRECDDQGKDEALRRRPDARRQCETPRASVGVEARTEVDDGQPREPSCEMRKHADVVAQ
jgi:hypothetical protein